MEEKHSQPKLAVLIDAENAQYSIIENLLAEIAKFGIASTKRIYGDWTHPKLKGWKDTLLKYSIQPFQQFEYTKGKNSSDSALIIDAMDLLYSGNFDGFCIVSSDSDFTRLAARLREAGIWFRRKENARSLQGRLRQIRLYRDPAGRLRRRRRKAECETKKRRRRNHAEHENHQPYPLGRGCLRRRFGLGIPRQYRSVHREEDSGFRLPKLRIQETRRIARRDKAL